MNTELQEQIRKYKENLENKLQEVTEERQEIIEKINSGENLAFFEGRKNKRLATLIKEIKERLKMFDELSLCEQMEKDLETLSTAGTTRDEKDKLVKKLVEDFKKTSKTVAMDVIADGILNEDDLNDISATKNNLKNDLDDLEKELKFAQKRGFKTIDIEKEIAEKKEKIEALEEYSKGIINEKELEKDLKDLSLSKTKKSVKKDITEKYQELISNYKDIVTEEIVINMEDDLIDLELDAEYEELVEKETLKDRTKNKLNKVTEWFKQNGKTIAKVTGGIVMAVAIIVVAKQCSKNINKNNNEQNIDNNPSIEQTAENNSKTIKQLINKGYNEYIAVIMAEKLSPETINTILNSPYNPAVENYATVNEFNYSYLIDYENARTIYNITPENAVDYVNRASKIQETGFYNDAEINDIVAVVKAIDDKNIFMSENSTLDQSINASLTDIYNNFAWTDGTSENDVKKVEALKYFAKEGTDLDKFLTEYAEKIQNVLNAKGNTETINKETNNMYNYLDTFANTFAGNSYDIENPNENAIVTDTFDWNIAYNTFVKPLISMYITEENVEDYACLHINMLSNYEQWAQANGCYLEDEQSLTLGGE